MKNLLPKVLWDYLVGAIVAAAALVVVLILVGFTSQAFLASSETGEMLRGGLGVIGLITFFGALLVVTIYELVMRRRAQGKMLEPGTTESRVLSRDVIIRALISGAVAGLYIAIIALLFTLPARGAADLNLFWVLVLGLLLAVMLVFAGALAYAYVGAAAREQFSKLETQERVTLLLLPLVLGVTFGFLFGAAAGRTNGIVSAFVAAILTYVLIRGLERLQWPTVRRSLEGVLQARGGPTIKVVSTLKAETPSVETITKELI